jgi:hypothetical protein
MDKKEKFVYRKVIITLFVIAAIFLIFAGVAFFNEVNNSNRLALPVTYNEEFFIDDLYRLRDSYLHSGDYYERRAIRRILLERYSTATSANFSPEFVDFIKTLKNSK